MNKLIPSIFSLVTAISLSACQAIDSDDSGVTYQGHCSQALISDHNNVMQRVRMLQFDASAVNVENARNLLVELQEKYPGVVCKALRTDPGSLDGVPDEIDIDTKTATLIEKLDAVLAPNR